MGSYTSTFKFYKPDPEEIVDVELNLNYNWRIADSICRGLLEYKNSPTQIPDVSDAFLGFRWYKSYSNAIWYWRDVGGVSQYFQDTYSRVGPWVSAAGIMASGWESHPDNPAQYRIVDTGSGTTEVEWSGAIWLAGAAPTLNLNYNPVMNLPGLIIPVVTKYFQQNAGNSTTGYNVARVGFFSAGQCELKIWGSGNWQNTAERKVDLAGIRYALEVPS